MSIDSAQSKKECLINDIRKTAKEMLIAYIRNENMDKQNISDDYGRKKLVNQFLKMATYLHTNPIDIENE